MKIKDLLDNFLNGELMPLRIIFRDKVCTYDEINEDYYYENSSGVLEGIFETFVITGILNEEIKILEEPSPFKIDDYVITKDRLHVGKIIDFCHCDNCKKRGYFEPVIDNKEMYITNYDKAANFDDFIFYHDIKDLVLSGDFIDGMQVFFEPDSLFDDKRVVILPGYLEYCPVSSLKNINHIVTKEEFESMGYRTGGQHVKNKE